MTNRYCITEFRHVETALEGIDDRLRTLAARIEEVDGRHDNSAALNDLADRVTALENGGPDKSPAPEPAKDGAKVPDGFEACSWEQATPRQDDIMRLCWDGTRLGFQTENARNGLVWLRPARPAPIDPERLADAIWTEQWDIKERSSFTDAVRRALARCRT